MPLHTSTAKDKVKDAYEEALSEAIARRKEGDILLICMDANANIGKGSLDGDEDHTAVGPYGIEHLNDAGRQLRSFLALNNLVSLSSFYKKNYYGTWQHPRSHQQYQLDHILSSREDLKRFTDAGGCRGQIIGIDYRAVRCTLRAAVRLQKKKTGTGPEEARTSQPGAAARQGHRRHFQQQGV